MSDALRVRDLTNTDERETVTVRPIVALLAREVEASFARHDGDTARDAWTGVERVNGFTERLHEDVLRLSTFPRQDAKYRAAIRCGAWVAFILAFLSDEEADHAE